jgi:hypothetical protein
MIRSGLLGFYSGARASRRPVQSVGPPTRRRDAGAPKPTVCRLQGKCPRRIMSGRESDTLAMDNACAGRFF